MEGLNILAHGNPFHSRDQLGNSTTGDGVPSRKSLHRLKQHPQSNSWGPRLPLTFHWKLLNKPLVPLTKGKAGFHGLHEKDLQVWGDHKLNVPRQGGVLHEDEISSLPSEQWPDAKKWQLFQYYIQTTAVTYLERPFPGGEEWGVRWREMETCVHAKGYPRWGLLTLLPTSWLVRRQS